MTLFEILNEFKAGKKIRRESWHKELWIEFRAYGSINGEPTQGLSRLYTNDPYDGVKLIDSDTRFSTEDILASDWVLYNE